MYIDTHEVAEFRYWPTISGNCLGVICLISRLKIVLQSKSLLGLLLWNLGLGEMASLGTLHHLLEVQLQTLRSKVQASLAIHTALG